MTFSSAGFYAPAAAGFLHGRAETQEKYRLEELDRDKRALEVYTDLLKEGWKPVDVKKGALEGNVLQVGRLGYLTAPKLGREELAQLELERARLAVEQAKHGVAAAAHRERTAELTKEAKGVAAAKTVGGVTFVDHPLDKNKQIGIVTRISPDGSVRGIPIPHAVKDKTAKWETKDTETGLKVITMVDGKPVSYDVTDASGKPIMPKPGDMTTGKVKLPAQIASTVDARIKEKTQFGWKYIRLPSLMLIASIKEMVEREGGMDLYVFELPEINVPGFFDEKPLRVPIVWPKNKKLTDTMILKILEERYDLKGEKAKFWLDQAFIAAGVYDKPRYKKKKK